MAVDSSQRGAGVNVGLSALYRLFTDTALALAAACAGGKAWHALGHFGSSGGGGTYGTHSGTVISPAAGCCVCSGRPASGLGFYQKAVRCTVLPADQYGIICRNGGSHGAVAFRYGGESADGAGESPAIFC